MEEEESHTKVLEWFPKTSNDILLLVSPEPLISLLPVCIMYV